MRRGYRPVLSELHAAKSIVEDLKALKDLQNEILQEIESLPRRGVTAAELRRDFGFSSASLRFLRKAGLLQFQREQVGRATYDLRPVLRLYAAFAMLTSIAGVRLRRKHVNFISVQKEIMMRIIDPPRSNTRRGKPSSGGNVSTCAVRSLPTILGES